MGFALYLAFMIPPLLIGLGVQAWLKRTFAKYSGVEVSSGLNGAAVARQILERNGLGDVPVEMSPGGPLGSLRPAEEGALPLGARLPADHDRRCGGRRP